MATLTYEPRTPNGAGFLPILIRALSRAWFVIGAHGHGWPMTVEMARAELTDARALIEQLSQPRQILGPTAREGLAEWQAANDTLIAAFQTAEQTDPEQLLDVHRRAIVSYARQTWALTALLDQDLLGLTAEQTDAGRRA